MDHDHTPVFAITGRRVMGAPLPLNTSQCWRNVSCLLKSKTLISRTAIFAKRKRAISRGKNKAVGRLNGITLSPVVYQFPFLGSTLVSGPNLYAIADCLITVLISNGLKN